MPTGQAPKNLFDRTLDCFEILAGAVAVLMMFAISFDVLMRYLFNETIEWVVGYCEFGLLYLTFLAAPWLLRADGHVRMDIVLVSLDEKGRNVLDILSSVICAVICSVLVWYGVEVSWELWAMRVVDPFKVLGFPKAAVVVIIPLGSLALLIQFLRRAWQAFSALQRGGAGFASRQIGRE